MPLPKSWTTVTPLSKTIALILFAFLPLISFFFGIRYQQRLDQALPVQNQPPAQIIERIVYQPLLSTSTWKTYTNTKAGVSFKYPSTWILTEKHTFSNREIDNPKEINTAFITGKSGEIVLEWGPMGYGGGCDTPSKITIDGKLQTICTGIDDHGRFWWNAIDNKMNDYEKANEIRATANKPLEENKQIILTIFSTIHYF